MPTLTFPSSVPALGLETVLFLPTVAVPTAVTVAETSAAGAVLISCAIRQFNVTADQSKTKKYRLCGKQGTEILGRTDWTIERPVFIDDPQALDSSTSYPHKALVEGTKGWLLRRQGLDSSPGSFVAFAAAQRYDIFSATFGVRVPIPVAPEEDGQEFEYGQEISLGQRFVGAIAA